MLKPFILARLPPCPNILLWGMGALLFFSFSLTQSMGNTMEEEIETLDVIEITGTVVEQAPRDLNLPLPEFHPPLPLNVTEHLSRPELKLTRRIPTTSRILLDQTSKTGRIFSPVKPLKMDRPIFPRRARENGWHGRVIMRLRISLTGTVESATIHKSSGHQLLDDSAIKAATQWQFQPAKNGGFPVTSKVNIPIQFDLVK